jgi:hypothetical protein
MLNYFAHAALTRGGLFQFSPGLAIKNYTSHSPVKKMKSPRKATGQHKQGDYPQLSGIGQAYRDRGAGRQRGGGKETEHQKKIDRSIRREEGALERDGIREISRSKDTEAGTTERGRNRTRNNGR